MLDSFLTVEEKTGGNGEVYGTVMMDKLRPAGHMRLNCSSEWRA